MMVEGKLSQVFLFFSHTNLVFFAVSYDYCDMNVGWRFADILVCDPQTKNLGVDISLINDVLQQHGGGAEPFEHLADTGDRELVEESFRELGSDFCDCGDEACLGRCRKNGRGQGTSTANSEGKED